MPRDAFQAWLDKMIGAYFDADFAAYVECHLLPISFITDNSITLIEDEALLSKGFHAWRQMMAGQKVTHIIRRAEEVVGLGEELMSGTYVSHILNDAIHVCPEYTSTATLRKDDGSWKAVSICSGLTNTSFPIVIPRVKR